MSDKASQPSFAKPCWGRGHRSFQGIAGAARVHWYIGTVEDPQQRALLEGVFHVAFDAGTRFGGIVGAIVGAVSAFLALRFLL